MPSASADADASKLTVCPGSALPGAVVNDAVGAFVTVTVRVVVATCPVASNTRSRIVRGPGVW